ncbi:Heme A synthase [Planctomycetes bacterium MalM25]|nr:Heme A synthase [Planctomycetes bacterium MalM25]
MSETPNSTTTASPWPHRWAWVLCCATFPLIWVGGLITTTDAGMAVPDWPGTYGYNLFLYPWRTWLFGPWDLLVEHGHRLFASGVGLLTIALLVVVWRNDRRPWLRRLAIAALALVLFQGVLGGLRVVLNERLLAMLHGTTGPLFFGLTAAIVAATAKPPADETPRATRWVWLLPILAFLQLFAGASLRHAPEASSFNTFAVHVQAHLWGALLVTLAVLATAWITWRRPVGQVRRWLAALLLGVVLLQVSLGVATWITKYRLPEWAQTGSAAHAWETVAGPGTIGPPTAGGWSETHLVTGHSATGSLLLALAVAHAVTARRSPATRPTPPAPATESP